MKNMTASCIDLVKHEPARPTPGRALSMPTSLLSHGKEEAPAHAAGAPFKIRDLLNSLYVALFLLAIL